MRLLVTGAAGFIGSQFVRTVLAEKSDAHIVVYDALRYSGNLSTMQDFWPHIRFYPGEIQNPGDLGSVVRIEKIDHLVNFAAESHNDRSILDNNGFVLTNVLGTQTVLDTCRKYDVERVVHVSTDEVYGSTLEGSFTEDSPICPNTPYSASKAGGDMLCRAHHKAFGTPVVVTRGGNTYGPYQYPEKLVPFFLTRLLQKKRVPLYGEGDQVREWIHVEDHARGVWTALTQGVAGEIYNVGDENERTNRVTVSLLLARLGLDESFVRKIEDPRKGAHDARYSLDSKKLRNLGWSPHRDFESSLQETADWFQSNEDWWRPIIGEPSYQSFVAQFYGKALGDDL